MKSYKEMSQLAQEGKTQILTLELAKELIGKNITIMYPGYAGQNGVLSFKVGSIQSEYEYYKTQPCEGFNNTTEYWESYMSKKELEETKAKLLILDEKLQSTCIFLNYDNYFCCGDSDRYVQFIIEDEN